MREWRRDFHRHPALGFEEHRTAAGRGRSAPTSLKKKATSEDLALRICTGDEEARINAGISDPRTTGLM